MAEKINVIHDIDVFGRENPNGTALEFLDNEAVKNALTCWITSKRGDYLRSPTEGGVLDNAAFKTMSPQNMGVFLFSLQNSIINYFYPAIEIVALDLNPDYENRILEIRLTYINPFSKKEESLIVYTDSPLDVKRWTYEDVEYEGDNLRNFVLLKKVDQLDKKLLFSADENYWCWGKFRFINFSQSSANFDEILTLCNLT